MSTAKRDKPEWLMPSIIFVVSLILLGWWFLHQLNTFDFGMTEDNATIIQTEQPDLSHVEQRDPSDRATAGPIDAPVTLVVFSDYQCPFCADWNTETLPELLPYTESGDLRIEWRDVDVYGEASQRAARAAHAAAEQDRYWDFHNALFPRGEPRLESELSEATLGELAESLELDVAQFQQDMGSEEILETLGAHQDLAESLGVTGTPIFILDGELMAGGISTETFVEKLEQALATTD